jgi:hypothetical protein
VSGDIKQVTGTGDVIVGPVYLHSVVLSHTAAGVVTIRDGSGAVRLTLRCPANGAAPWEAQSKEGVLFSTSINVASITGTANVEYS